MLMLTCCGLMLSGAAQAAESHPAPPASTERPAITGPAMLATAGAPTEPTSQSASSPSRPGPDLIRPPAMPQLSAELRFRAARPIEPGGLQPGPDEGARGIFHRVRLGAAFERGELSARLQLQASGALGEAAPGALPLAVGLQEGVVRGRLPLANGLHVEAGRMALSYGAGRHIGSYDFHSSGHAFDGLRVQLAVDTVLALDLLSVKIRRNSAQPDKERNLTGLYLSGLPQADLRADLYFLYLGDGTATEEARLLTMGSRVDWQPSRHLGLEGEASVQVGTTRRTDQVEPDDHLATALAATVRVKGTLGAPVSVVLRGHAYSGDQDEGDRVLAAWRPLYPSLDQQVGLMQVFAPSNLAQVALRLRVELGGEVGEGVARWALELEGLASAARKGAPLSGYDGRTLDGDDGWLAIGREIDARLAWHWTAASEVLLAAAWFVPTDGTDVAGREDLGDAGLVLLQWTSRF